MVRESLKARGIFPSLTVSDVAASRKFYVDGLGFSIKDEWKEDKGKLMGFMLNAGPAKLQWGKMAFAVTDPDGYKLTVTEPNS